MLRTQEITSNQVRQWEDATLREGATETGAVKSEEHSTYVASGCRIRTMPGENGRYALNLLNRSTGESIECEVVLHRAGDHRTLRVVLPDGSVMAEANSAEDFEDALTSLREELEDQNIFLLCNRYRIDAFVSTMSRQMSDGLGCYIVKRHRPVDPSLIVGALEPAPPQKVSTKADADEFIARWIASFDD